MRSEVRIITSAARLPDNGIPTQASDEGFRSSTAWPASLRSRRTWPQPPSVSSSRAGEYAAPPLERSNTHGADSVAEDGEAAPRAIALSVALPCYNEESIVRDHVLKVVEHLRKTESSFEILISDDASEDRTAAILAEIVEPEVRVFRYANGPTRRENLALTLRESRGEVVAYMDMDLSSGLDRLSDLIGAVRSGRADIAVGSRRLPGSQTQRGMLRRWFSGAYNSTVRLLFASRVRDHQCGFKAMRYGTLQWLLDLMGYDGSLQRGWFWDAELLIRAQHLGLRVEEIPVRWIESAKSSFRFRQELRVVRYMLRSRARIRRGAREASP